MIFLVVLVATNVMIAAAGTVTDMSSAREHFGKYFIGANYQNLEFGNKESEAQMESVIEAYQAFMGLNVTGQLDAITMAEMNKPRCGMADMTDVSSDTKRRRKRFVLQGSKWPTHSPLSYKFINHTPDLSRTLVESIFARAFKAWSDVAKIDFYKKTSGEADFDILFAAGRHVDGSFDGPGGTLAHAYFPQYGGDAHFDEDETWTEGTSRGINLYQVAVHEIGHSLGLSHSSVRGAIMFPTYSGHVPNYQLHSDDIQGIRMIYGARNTGTPKPTPRPTPRPTARPTARPTPRPTPAPTFRPTSINPNNRQRFCTNVHFDAITHFGGKTYAFRDDLYADLDPELKGIKQGFPRSIASGFPGAPPNIDAALAWEEYYSPRLFLFKGSQYWRYELDEYGRIFASKGYPKLISANFRGIPNNIDSAFVWGKNGRTYIFAGTVYYRLKRDPATNYPTGIIDRGYPKKISAGWRLPHTYDAATQWRNGRTYLFKDGEYVRYNDFTSSIDTNVGGSGRYPRSLEVWTRCSDPSSPVQEEEDMDGDSQFQMATQQDADDMNMLPTTTTHINQTGSATSYRQGAHTALACVLVTLAFL